MMKSQTARIKKKGGHKDHDDDDHKGNGNGNGN